jgi:polar amino acid transport system substrate-binding protein
VSIGFGSLILIAGSVQADKPIRIVVDPWPPFGGSELHQDGISRDAIATVLQRAGYRVETTIVSWQRALDGMKAGTYDVIGTLLYSADLAEECCFQCTNCQNRSPFAATPCCGPPIC